MRVLVLHESALNPLRVPLFNALAERLQHNGAELQVAWLRTKIPNKRWSCDASTISHEFSVLQPWRVPALLLRSRPDVVIGSYGSVAGWLGLMWCRLCGKKFILWSGTWALATHRSRGVRPRLKRWFVTQCCSYIAYGTKPADYLITLGAASDAIFTAINVPDLAFYDRAVREFRANPGFASLRARWTPIVLLYAGQLTPHKGILHLLKALEPAKNDESWKLVVAGEGPLRARLPRVVMDLGLQERVSLVGFVDRPRLVEYFGVADIFVQPSLFDPFSLVLSEALAAGLYVVASKYDGATYDLIQEGRNGEIVDPVDISGMSRVLLRLIRDRSSLPARSTIRDSIRHATLDRYAAVIEQSISYAVAK